MPAEPSGKPSDPFFSVVVTTYDRAQIVRRCVESCLAQSFSDFEVVVVDDGSTDGTAGLLERIGDQRLRVVVHEANRGISPARHTGVANASGEWIVSLDSDDELFPDTLERLQQIIERLPPDVRIVRSRLLWDDGSVTPKVVPAGRIDYEARIRWMEADWGSDSGRCMHRSVFDANPYFSDRRGPVEALHELNLSRSEISICVDDVLGKCHTDARARAGPTSSVRSIAAFDLARQLTREAPDMLWMAETTLDQHGAALARNAPRVHRTLIRTAAAQAFLLGDRAKGTHYARAALKKRRLDPMVLATLALGLLGPRAVVGGALAYRWMNRFRR